MRNTPSNIIISNRHLFIDKVLKTPFSSYALMLCRVSFGSAVWEIDKKKYPLSSGDIAVINNCQKRRFTEICGEGLKMDVIEIQPGEIYNTVFVNLFYGKKTFIFRQDGQIAALFDSIIAEFSGRAPLFETMVESQTVHLMCNLYRKTVTEQTQESKVNRNIIKLLKFIDESFTSSISLTDAAAHMYMHPTTFSVFFKKNIGIGFSAFITEKRINYSVYLLENTGKTVLDIAMEAGYNTLSGFYKAFKKTTGKNPAYYRTGGNSL